MVPALRATAGTTSKDYSRDKEMPKASAQSKAGAQTRGSETLASSEVIWESQLAGDEDPVDPHTSVLPRGGSSPVPLCKQEPATPGVLLSQGSSGIIPVSCLEGWGRWQGPSEGQK